MTRNQPAAAPVILDVSRLLSRARYHTPSGVDRVEMAYARGLDARLGNRLAFAAVHPFGAYGRLSANRVFAFLDAMEARWAMAAGDAHPRRLATVLPPLLRLWPTAPQPVPGNVYVQASPHHLTRQALVANILKREQARFLCLVHDLIPLDYPEYARPGGAALHARRIATITALADGILANSGATAQSLKPWLDKAGRGIVARVALLGTHQSAPAEPPAQPPDGTPGAPYFICVGTIEPRKNHLLLLHLWRAMAEAGGAIPRLILVGRRGWENEQVIDMLERCGALSGHVEELNGCSDRRMAALVRGARALLLPSFAEGYGMPVAEALSAGTPVLCSDLPALREAGAGVPDFLDPLDGPGWAAHIRDYGDTGPLYQAQLRRLAGWRPPTWEEHIEIVCDAIAALQR